MTGTKRSHLFRLLLTACAISFTVVYFCAIFVKDFGSTSLISVTQNETRKDHRFHGVSSEPRNIKLCSVVCGDRVNDVLVMIKSAIILTNNYPLHLILFAESHIQPLLREHLQDWKTKIKSLSYDIMDINYPVKSGANEWKKLFKPCASQRLFLPTLLTDVDSLLYVDTDVIFLRPLQDVWSFFYDMNSTQLAALAPESEDYTTGWYNRFAKHPYYGPLGVNSGVMLMNLTKMRQFGWQNSIVKIYEEYKHLMTWGDQDIINIMFFNHPDKLYIYPCEWNYRSDHCMYQSVCKSAEQYGVSVMHGSRKVFHNNKEPSFKAIYEVFRQYKFGDNLERSLLQTMKNMLKNTTNTNCGKYQHILLKQLQKFIYTLPER